VIEEFNDLYIIHTYIADYEL